ncbi:MAG TPA: hypothetical protein VF052_01210 [Solirubrobacterales bacterium]
MATHAPGEEAYPPSVTVAVLYCGDSQAMPVYEFTDEFATMEAPPPDMQQLIGAMHGNQEAMDDFVSVQAATLPAPDFFAPEKVGRIMGSAGVAG